MVLNSSIFLFELECQMPMVWGVLIYRTPSLLWIIDYTSSFCKIYLWNILAKFNFAKRRLNTFAQSEITCLFPFNFSPHTYGGMKITESTSIVFNWNWKIANSGWITAKSIERKTNFNQMCHIELSTEVIDGLKSLNSVISLDLTKKIISNAIEMTLHLVFL